MVKSRINQPPSGVPLQSQHPPNPTSHPLPVTRVRCDVDEAPLWCRRGVLTHSAGLRAPEWGLAQDDRRKGRRAGLCCVRSRISSVISARTPATVLVYRFTVLVMLLMRSWQLFLLCSFLSPHSRTKTHPHFVSLNLLRGCRTSLTEQSVCRRLFGPSSALFLAGNSCCGRARLWFFGEKSR